MKTINEANEQLISAETMGNHFVQYDFLYFTSSVNEMETQVKRVSKNAWHLSKL